MTILKKIPDEQTYYEFEDCIELDTERFIICGNSHFIRIGDSKLLDIVDGNYYDEDTEYNYETLEQLKKVTGKVWEEATLRGYSQGDWQTLYYVVDEVTEEEIKNIENFYMGKVTEFEIDENGDGDTYHDFIPDEVVWGGKKSICDYFGFKVEDTTVYEDDGYMKVYKYKEIT